LKIGPFGLLVFCPVLLVLFFFLPPKTYQISGAGMHGSIMEDVENMFSDKSLAVLEEMQVPPG
jgi:hypothetical protein